MPHFNTELIMGLLYSLSCLTISERSAIFHTSMSLHNTKHLRMHFFIPLTSAHLEKVTSQGRLTDLSKLLIKSSSFVSFRLGGTDGTHFFSANSVSQSAGEIRIALSASTVCPVQITKKIAHLQPQSRIFCWLALTLFPGVT